jgi:RHS repeat-associated protein
LRFVQRGGEKSSGGWPRLERELTLEGAPSKLRLGGDFDVCPSQTVKRFLLYSLGSQTDTGTLTWNADGTPATVDSRSLTYDALGRMVDDGTRAMVVGPSGNKPLAFMSGQTLSEAFIPLPGGGMMRSAWGWGWGYRHGDWLGSVRLLTSMSQTLISDEAYAPFGEGYAHSGGADDYGYTQGTTESLGQLSGQGLVDFPFRKYHATQGRWISPDPAGLAAVNPANPQSWNRYAYVMNNPLAMVDPLGLCPTAGVWADHAHSKGCVNVKYPGPGNPHCSIDGAPVNCGLAMALIGAGAAYPDSWNGQSCFQGSDGNSYCGNMENKIYFDPQTYLRSLPPDLSFQLNRYLSTANNWGPLYPPSMFRPGALPTLQVPPKSGPKPLSFWDKTGLVIACIAGMNPEFAAPMGTSPQPYDSTDSTNTTEGQGPPYLPNKTGRSVPYGPSNEIPNGAAGGAAYGGGVAQCITNVFTAWPK